LFLDVIVGSAHRSETAARFRNSKPHFQFSPTRQLARVFGKREYSCHSGFIRENPLLPARHVIALKDLLVYLDQTEESLVRLRLAVDLAARHESRLTALYVREWNLAQLDARKSAELGLVSAEAIHGLDRGIEASIDAVAERWRSSLHALTRGHGGLQAQLHCVDGVAAVVVPRYARCADLSILGLDQPEGPASVNYTFSEHMLFVTGRPVLFVPALETFTTLGRHIVVAWNASRPAARSVNDALPLIERAERTTGVLMPNPAGFTQGHDAPPGERIVEHLKRHGASPNLVRIENVPAGSIADKLQTEARAYGADLIVAGAFGHPRLWEKMLGGVTHDLIARTCLPLFMSH
jgi:nucleotide-binding universal stress UspA family protein